VFLRGSTLKQRATRAPAGACLGAGGAAQDLRRLLRVPQELPAQ